MQNSIKPLQIRDKLFANNMIQGPLAGISSAPFRLLTWEYSKPAFTCTEMISCSGLVRKSLRTLQRYVVRDPKEGTVCYQLAGSDPTEVAEAVKMVTDFGADLIDLNCGCPVRKMRKTGACSSLLTNPTRLYTLIKTMKQNTHVPISIKIRVEGGSDDVFNQEIAKVVTEAGADYLIVHGRHWTEHYETPCNHDQIKFFVEEMKIPVIGNGDIACKASLQKMLDTGCAGVMIARAGVGQPWLIKKLMAQMNNEEFITPDFEEIKNVFLEHIENLGTLLDSEKFAVVHSRKMAKYYARGIPKRSEFTVAVNNCHTYEDLKKICEQYFTFEQN